MVGNITKYLVHSLVIVYMSRLGYLDWLEDKDFVDPEPIQPSSVKVHLGSFLL